MDGTRAECLQRYRDGLEAMTASERGAFLHGLHGYEFLACFCAADADCHGDVLIEMLRKEDEAFRDVEDTELIERILLPTTGGCMEEKTTFIAQVCHHVNRAYCLALGDDSQPLWTEAPEWQKSSAIKGVAFHLNNPDASPSASHDEWLKEKAASGWIYGPVKDAEKKEHPCYVPYEQLPVEQRAKDYLFKAIVEALR